LNRRIAFGDSSLEFLVSGFEWMAAEHRVSIVLFCACTLALAGGCASSGDGLADSGPPTVGEELTTGQQVLNVVTFPFRMVGYGLYYPLKFIFYDIWVALFDWLFGSDDEGEGVDALVDRLDDAEPETRALAAFHLGFHGSAAQAEALVPLIADRDDRVRAAAVTSLGRIGTGAVGEAITPFTSDRRPEVRAAAVRLVGLLRAKKGVELLTKAMDDPVWSVRTEAAVALGRMGSWAAGPKLIAALKDPDPRVRGKAALGLNLMGDARALPALVEVFRRLEKEGTFVRANVISALAELGATDLTADLLRLAKGEGPVKDPHSRAAALIALGKFRLEAGKPVLAKILTEGREPLRVLDGAALGLGRMKAVETLKTASRSGEVLVRAAAANGWIEAGGPEAVRALGVLATDPYVDVRQRSIVALLILGHKKAVVFIIDHLTSPDPQTRAWAYMELRRISGEDLGLEGARWLDWWEGARETWELRRFYPSPEGKKP
jgi:HEAT repeat protein